MRYIPMSLRRAVIERAANRCEYCKLAQAGQEATFHIDHVIPIAAGGKTVLENLALACVSCSLSKSDRQIISDPETEADVPMFNPRLQRWADHFYWDEFYLIGRTPIGRATIEALNLNRSIIVTIRSEEAFFRRHPPEIPEE
ncbi:MAG: HNH endonuclease [Caldilineaceae bacterium]